MTTPRILTSAVAVAGTVAFIAGWRVEHHTRKWTETTHVPLRKGDEWICEQAT